MTAMIDAEASRRQANWVGFITVVRREYGRIMRIWGQTLVPPAITATLYFIIFGTLIGRRIGDMNGHSYAQYIAPGLIMMTVITNSFGNVVSSFFGAKYGKHIEELLVSPLPNRMIVTGYMFGGMCRGFMVGSVVTIISLLFTHLHVEHPLVVICAVTLTSMIFALAGMVNAVFAKNFDQINFIPTFVLTPMTYLGGVFYSVSQLPDLARTLSHLNPILYMVNAFRYGFIGQSDVSLALAFSIMIGAASSLYLLCLYLLHKGIGLRE